MDTQMQIEGAPTTPWKRFHRWSLALDQAFNFDPAEHLQASVRQLNERVQQLEAVMRRLKASDSSQTEDRK